MHRADALRTILLAAVIGVPISIAGILLLAFNHELEHLVWHTLPDQLGVLDGGDPAWWYVVAATTIAAAIAAALLLRVRQDVSHEVPLTPVPLGHLPWLLAGAAATLAGGLVLGPEAPLLVLGVAMASIAARRIDGDSSMQSGAVLSLAGAAAVLGLVLGNAVIGVVLLLEIVVASGKVEASKVTPALIPAIVAAGIGSLVYTGFGSWTGITPSNLSIPDLPAYDEVQLLDLLLAIPVAIVSALVVIATHRAAATIRPQRWLRSVPGTAAIGLATGAAAVAYRAIADRPIDDVLFSGQTALPEVVAIDAAWILALLVLAKGFAYVLALVGQLEGGQIFPALALSAAVGVATSVLVPDASLTAMLAISIAAGTTALQRLPIFGIVFALLLVAGADVIDIAPFAMLGAVISYLIAAAVQQRAESAASTAPAA